VFSPSYPLNHPLKRVYILFMENLMLIIPIINIKGSALPLGAPDCEARLLPSEAIHVPTAIPGTPDCLESWGFEGRCARILDAVPRVYSKM